MLFMAGYQTEGDAGVSRSSRAALRRAGCATGANRVRLEDLRVK